MCISNFIYFIYFIYFQILFLSRRERSKVVESWAADDASGRFFKFSGQSWEVMRQTLEDIILEVAAIDPTEAAKTEAAKTRMLTRLRMSHGTVTEAFKRTNIGAKYGIETMEKLFRNADENTDLTEEEAKTLKGLLKEKEKNGGGKWSGMPTTKGSWQPGGGNWGGRGYWRQTTGNN